MELKYIVGYLPYELGMQHKYTKAKHRGETKLRLWQTKLEPLSLTNLFYQNGKGFDFHLILRPLSDLEKEIEVNGEKFVPIEKLRELYFETSEIENGGVYIETLVFKGNEFKNFTQDLCYTGDNNHEYHRSIGYKTSIEIYEKLYEWHFDIHGLIEQDLAIDINKL